MTSYRMNSSETLELTVDKTCVVDESINIDDDDNKQRINNIERCTKDTNKKSQSFVIFNLLFAVIICFTLKFIAICVFYAFGQLITLELNDYFCEKKELDEIYKHSQKYGLNEGSAEPCWSTSSYQVNEEILFNAGSLTPYKSVWNITNSNVMKCTLFLIPACFLVIILLWFIYKKIRISCNSADHHAVLETHQKQSCCTKMIISIKTKVSNNEFKTWYKKHIGIHTTIWTLKMTTSETIEIVIQSIVFVQYGGGSLWLENNILDYMNISSHNDLIPAESKQYIILFVSILSLNCILTGIVWILYLFFKPHCRGKQYGIVIFFVDAIFDTFYLIFPLLLLGQSLNFKTAPAKLAENLHTTIAFISVLYPLFMLSAKIFSTFKNIINNHYDDDQINVYELDQEQQNTNYFKIVCGGICLTKLEDFSQNKCKYIIQLIRRFFLLLWSISVICYGVGIFVIVHQHFDRNEQICSNYIEYIEEYPELYLWEYCNYKVYPFYYDDNGPCNCRSFQFAINQSQRKTNNNTNNITITINNNMIESLLTHWNMLEAFKFKGNDLLIRVKLNETQLQSTNMRVFYLESVGIDYIHDLFGINWNKLEFLDIKSTSALLPNSTALLTNLKYLDISYNIFIPSIDFICNMKDLQILLLIAATNIDYVPNCIEHLINIKYIDITGGGIKSIMNMMNLPKLEEFSYIYGQLDIPSFGREQFDYNNKTRFSFTYSPVCKSYLPKYQHLSIPDHKNYIYVYDFLNATNACFEYCSWSTSFDLDIGICFKSEWQNGVCNENCKSKFCGYDGGDCYQLCECDMQLLLNDNCDLLCNTTFCEYDKGQCLNISQTQDTNVTDIECNGFCSTIWNLFVSTANTDAPDYQLDEAELCAVWLIIVHSSFDQYNCSTLIPVYDQDGNGKLSALEASVLLKQVDENEYDSSDCSVCADSIYQWVHGCDNKQC